MKTAEDEEFERIERESRSKNQEAFKATPSREQLMAEVAVLTELVRVLSDRVKELEKGKEPVAWNLKDVTDAHKLGAKSQQRTWVGLTDEDVERYWDWEDFQTGAGRSTIFEMVRDIEAKLKEKNL